jgi:hypothetical protein
LNLFKHCMCESKIIINNIINTCEIYKLEYIFRKYYWSLDGVNNIYRKYYWSLDGVNNIYRK